MDIEIDSFTNTMRWKHNNLAYEYKIESAGHAVAYESGDCIYIEIYNEGHFSHRVLSVKGENKIWYNDSGEVKVFSDVPVTMHFSEFQDLCVAPFNYYIMTETQLLKLTTEGKEISKIPSPLGYRFYRFWGSSPLSVICEQIGKTTDRYGRNEWKFEWNSQSLEWKLITVVQ